MSKPVNLALPAVACDAFVIGDSRGGGLIVYYGCREAEFFSTDDALAKRMWEVTTENGGSVVLDVYDGNAFARGQFASRDPDESSMKIRARAEERILKAGGRSGFSPKIG